MTQYSEDSLKLGKYPAVGIPVCDAPASTAAPQSSGSVASRLLGFVIIGLNLGKFVTYGVDHGYTYGPLSDALVFGGVKQAIDSIQDIAVSAFRNGKSARNPLGPLTIMSVHEESTTETMRESMPSGKIYKLPDDATIAGYVINTEIGYIQSTFNGLFAGGKTFTDATLFASINAVLVALQKNSKNSYAYFGSATVEIVVESSVTKTWLQEKPLA